MLVDLVKVLPLAFLMIMGPQIVTAIFLATSYHPRRNSVAFVIGAAAATALGTAISFVAAKKFGLHGADELHKQVWIYWLLIVLLVLLGIRILMRRKQNTAAPKWMGKIQTTKPSRSIVLGFVLFLIFPTDLISWLTVGAEFASHDNPYWYTLVFTLIVALFTAIPLFLLLLLGKRSEIVLPRIRQWMDTHSWIVSEILVVFFILLSISDVIGG